MITSFREVPKSPTREQQIQPEFISRISIPDSFRKPPSIPISPNSFSINTTCCPFKASDNSFLINVVLPAPRKPEIMSIFVIILFLSKQLKELSHLHIQEHLCHINILICLLPQPCIFCTFPYYNNFSLKVKQGTTSFCCLSRICQI